MVKPFCLVNLLNPGRKVVFPSYDKDFSLLELILHHSFADRGSYCFLSKRHKCVSKTFLALLLVAPHLMFLELSFFHQSLKKIISNILIRTNKPCISPNNSCLLSCKFKRMYSSKKRIPCTNVWMNNSMLLSRTIGDRFFLRDVWNWVASTWAGKLPAGYHSKSFDVLASSSFYPPKHSKKNRVVITQRPGFQVAKAS